MEIKVGNSYKVSSNYFDPMLPSDVYESVVLTEMDKKTYTIRRKDGSCWWMDIEKFMEYQRRTSKCEVVEQNSAEYTGGSSNYYKVFVSNPTTATEPYYAECNDIIEALGMDFAEGNAFKAIWRKAAARKGVKKKGYDNGVYDSEKVVFFGERMLSMAKSQENCD